MESLYPQSSLLCCTVLHLFSVKTVLLCRYTIVVYNSGARTAHLLCQCLSAILASGGGRVHHDIPPGFKLPYCQPSANTLFIVSFVMSVPGQLVDHGTQESTFGSRKHHHQCRHNIVTMFLRLYDCWLVLVIMT